jgi:hypothetical protein
MRNGLGIVCVPAAGFLFLIGCLVRGEYVLASPGTAERFAAWATRPAFTAGYFILMAAATTSVFGYVALAGAVQGRGARTAMVLSITGVQFLLALFGAAVVLQGTLARAFLGGDAAAVHAAERGLSSGALLGIAAMTALNAVGHAVFAVAICRTPGLSRMAAVLFVLGPIGMLMPFIYPVELTGCGLYLAAGATIALNVLRRRPHGPAVAAPVGSLTVVGRSG